MRLVPLAFSALLALSAPVFAQDIAAAFAQYGISASVDSLSADQRAQIQFILSDEAMSDAEKKTAIEAVLQG